MNARGLRIIAGRLKGRRLRVPAAASVRPTPERVREALFSILGQRIELATVLDAFAGSGALGFEALSRGAGRVVFVDSDRRVAARLRDNAAALGAKDDCRIVEGSLPRVLERTASDGPFDLVLADPPYAATEDERSAALAGLGRVLAPEGLLVCERPSRGRSVTAAGLDFLESRRYGNSSLDLYTGKASPKTPECRS